MIQWLISYRCEGARGGQRASDEKCFWLKIHVLMLLFLLREKIDQNINHRVRFSVFVLFFLFKKICFAVGFAWVGNRGRYNINFNLLGNCFFNMLHIGSIDSFTWDAGREIAFVYVKFDRHRKVSLKVNMKFTRNFNCFSFETSNRVGVDESPCTFFSVVSSTPLLYVFIIFIIRCYCCISEARTPGVVA